MISELDQLGGPHEVVREITEGLLLMKESIPFWGEFTATQRSVLTKQFFALVKNCPKDFLPVLAAIPNLPEHWRQAIAEAAI